MAAQPPRGSYRPPVPPPAPPAPPATPPSPANSGNGGPQPNTIAADQIYADGINAADALTAILGADNVTGNNQVDCRAAMKAIDEWLAALDARRAVILHLMFNDYAHRENRAQHQRNNWVWVAGQVCHPPATVSKWAHKVACYDTINSDQD